MRKRFKGLSRKKFSTRSMKTELNVHMTKVKELMSFITQYFNAQLYYHHNCFCSLTESNNDIFCTSFHISAVSCLNLSPQILTPQDFHGFLQPFQTNVEMVP